MATVIEMERSRLDAETGDRRGSAAEDADNKRWVGARRGLAVVSWAIVGGAHYSPRTTPLDLEIATRRSTDETASCTSPAMFHHAAAAATTQTGPFYRHLSRRRAVAPSRFLHIRCAQVVLHSPPYTLLLPPILVRIACNLRAWNTHKRHVYFFSEVKALLNQFATLYKLRGHERVGRFCRSSLQSASAKHAMPAHRQNAISIQWRWNNRRDADGKRPQSQTGPTVGMASLNSFQPGSVLASGF